MSETKPIEIKIKAAYFRYLLYSFIISFLLVLVAEHFGRFYDYETEAAYTEYSGLGAYFITPFGKMIKISRTEFQEVNSEFEASAYVSSLWIYVSAVFKDFKVWLVSLLIIYVGSITYINLKGRLKIKITE